MTNIVSLKDRELFRSELAEEPEIQAALSIIEDCDWDLEEATALLALKEGYSVDITRGNGGESFISRFLNKQATDIRALICRDSFKEILLPGLVTTAITSLAASAGFSTALAVPLVLYLIAFGTEEICKSDSN